MLRCTGSIGSSSKTSSIFPSLSTLMVHQLLNHQRCSCGQYNCGLMNFHHTFGKVQSEQLLCVPRQHVNSVPFHYVHNIYTSLCVESCTYMYLQSSLAIACMTNIPDINMTYVQFFKRAVIFVWPLVFTQESSPFNCS